ncbi:MAG TPA: hypothetical protein VHI93_00955 [Candidatus Thermoplasmatota archaeon]|nr:hypothetical protein [Candidatus Thermoplasmatota archaeon]
MSPRLLPLLVVALVAASGCASQGPSGTVKALDYQVPVFGSVLVAYQPFSGANPTGGLPQGDATQCAHDQLPPPPAGAAPLPPCRGPYSDFRLQATLPPPASGGYKLYAVGPGFERELAALAGEAGSYSAHANVSQDLSAQVEELQVRMEGLPIAVADGAAGNHTLALAPALGQITVSGTFTGRHLEVTVAGLPANATYVARLYVADPASPTGHTATESFEVRNGVTAHDAQQDIADFSEFHIHVGTSMVNLYKATLATA